MLQLRLDSRRCRPRAVSPIDLQTVSICCPKSSAGIQRARSELAGVSRVLPPSFTTRGSTTTVKMSRVGVTKTFRNVTHAIFDMDGLLLDTESLYTEATQQIIGEFGKTYTWKVKDQLLGLNYSDAAKKIVSVYDLPITWEEYAKRALQIYKVMMPKAQLMPDTEVAYFRVVKAILARHGKDYTPELRAKVLGMQAVDTCKTLVRETNLPMRWQEMHAQYQPALFKLVQNTSLLPGVERLIKHLYNNNVPCAVATSSSGQSFAIKSQCHKEFFSMFKHIVTGGSDPEVKHGKPAPDIFQLAADRFPDSPSYDKCLVFEDAPNGVKGALAAGMQVVMVPDEHTDKNLTKDATIVLKSLKEFQPELFGLPGFPNKCVC